MEQSEIPLRRTKQQVAVLEPPVASDAFPALQCQRLAEDGTGIDAGVELAALATGIHGLWQCVEKRAVKVTPRPLRRCLVRVHATHNRAETIRDELASERRGVPSPERKERLPGVPGEESLAVGADILEEQVSEGDCADAGECRSRPRQGCQERGLVRGVRSGCWNRRFI